VTKARSVIIATGAKAKLLGLPEERTVDQGGLMGAGVSTCATCDGAFFKDAELIVVGGGDSAMEEANFLTRFAKTVTIVHRRNEFRASRIMLDRAKANEKIKFVLDSTITNIHATNGQVSAATIKNLKTGDSKQVPVEGVFVAIGHTPNSGLFKGKIELDENGYITVKKGMMTSVPGVFACGDVVDHVYRQAITAAGMGCQAAIDTERWLAHAEHVEAPIHAGAWGATTPAK
jgi:thioredoxin reductase (NADPH)